MQDFHGRVIVWTGLKIIKCWGMRMGREISIRIYIKGKRPQWRLNNIKALALKHYPKSSGKEGNVSAMFLIALHEKWNLDSETSLPIEPLSEMVADAPRKSPQVSTGEQLSGFCPTGAPKRHTQKRQKK